MNKNNKFLSLSLIFLAFAFYAILLSADFYLPHINQGVGELLVSRIDLLGNFSIDNNANNGVGLDYTFNSMLEHLLNGRFDVSAESVGAEGYLHDGKLIAYWGIFCALIRAPLLLIKNGLLLNVTTLSCFIAVCISAAVKFETLNLIYSNTSQSIIRNFFYWLLVLTILFSGAQISFLKPSLYQEVCFWSGALGAIFIFFAVKGIVSGDFSVSLMNKMAVVAGLALLCRVTMGIGLYFALIALLGSNIFYLWNDNKITSKQLKASLLTKKILAPSLLLLGFAIMTGLVNYFRWGNPFTFVDFTGYLMNYYFPDRPLRLEAYGVFNAARIPYSLLYYFLPIWSFRDSDKDLWFGDEHSRLFDSLELPAGSFFLTDPLLILLFCIAIYFWAKNKQLLIVKSNIFLILLGLLSQCALVLMASALSHRYRIDFYPALEFGAFIGYWYLCKASLTERTQTRLKYFGMLLTAIGVLSSFIIFFLYFLSDPGPAIPLLNDGIWQYYLQKVFELKTQLQ
ncbi:hypothetical protein ICN49_11005 [Polynucleobacter sp. MWH-Mekk-B1]|uniref:hypothetical protein n=1 Tax=Polynucleobacter finlandensis TaxID=1855894 RepID=UPI001C0C1169|nr:hypothetical protein [Polynucleobacter finlandensis]MBU3545449.1 hypothetical protein [Polynucleobacter finlandensis]